MAGYSAQRAPTSLPVGRFRPPFFVGCARLRRPGRPRPPPFSALLFHPSRSLSSPIGDTRLHTVGTCLRLALPFSSGLHCRDRKRARSGTVSLRNNILQVREPERPCAV